MAAPKWPMQWGVFQFGASYRQPGRLTRPATLASATPSDGQYDWVPGNAFPPGPGYAIRVSSVTSPVVSDQSDAPFALLPTTLTNTLFLPSASAGRR